MRLLLVEDHAELAEWVSRALLQTGYVVDVLSRGDHADHALLTQPYDLVILDLSLPGMHGLDVLKRLRSRPGSAAIPVLILTASGSTDDKVRGLNLGADDYLPKPFELAELEARIKALIRRSSNLVPVVRVGRLEFDTISRLVSIEGKPLSLTPARTGRTGSPGFAPRPPGAARDAVRKDIQFRPGSTGGSHRDLRLPPAQKTRPFGGRDHNAARPGLPSR